MVGLGQQGAWTKWENTLQRRITWSDFWWSDMCHIRFLIQAVYDTLPSPANLHTWGKTETPACPLCAGRGSLQHLLSNCPTALTRVVTTGATIRCSRQSKKQKQSTAIQSSKHQPRKKTINFLKARKKPLSQPSTRASHLSTAPDWQLRVELGSQLKFLSHIVETRLRPDLVIRSDSTKQVIVWELTMPWEERIEETHERKLVEQCSS